MADDTDTAATGWGGQPPPFLSAYGDAPAPNAGANLQAPSPAVAAPSLPEAAPPLPSSAPAEIQMPDDVVAPSTPSAATPSDVAPTPQQLATGQPAFAPPWLQAAQQSVTPYDINAPLAAPAPPMSATDAALAYETNDTTKGDAYENLKRTAMDPNASDADRQTAWKELSPQDRLNLVNSSDPKQLAAVANAAMSPEESATIQVRHAQAQQLELSARQHDLAVRQDQEARQNFQTYQGSIQYANARSASLEQDAARIANMRVDPAEHGVGNFIGRVLLGFGGGFASPATGGKNLALDELQKLTDQRIQAQKDAIANQWQGVKMKQNLVAEGLQRSGDLYHAQEAYRVATYDRAQQELLTEAQNYDPKGTTNLKIQQAVSQVAAQRAATLNAYWQATQKQRLEQTKVQVDVNKQLEETRHNKAQEANENWKTSIEAKKAAAATKPDVVYTPEQLTALYGKDAAVPPIPMDQKQYSAWLEGKQKNTEIAGKTVENQASSAKNSVALPVQAGATASGQPVIATQTLTQKNGQTWRPPEKFQPMAAATTNVVRLADKLTREIRKNGGQSDLRKSPEWQTMKSDYQDLVFALHGAKGIEGFRPGTSELLHELTGGVDPTSFLRSAIPGIQNAKQNVVEDLNATATAGGYDGAPIQFVDTSNPPPPAKTEIGELARTAAADPEDDNSMGGNGEYNFHIPAEAASSEESAHAIETGIPPVQLGALHKLQEALFNPSTEKQARAALNGLIDKAADPAVSNWAESVLKLVPEGKK